jgi:hypothetical protein
MSSALFYLQLALAAMGLADAPAEPPPAVEDAATPEVRPVATSHGSAGRSADQAADTEIYNGF